MRLAKLLWVVVLAGSLQAAEITKIGEVGHPALGEISGIVASSHAGAYWVHNDSGDEARMFAILPEGQVILPDLFDLLYPGGTPDQWPGYAVDNAWQYDWEDMAAADGMIYLADVGNNDNARRDMGVYVVPEPNPRAVLKTRAMRFLPIRYPDQSEYPARLWHFDCEAVFSDGGSLYFLTKHRQPGQAMGWERGTKLYRLTSEHTDRYNVLKLVDRHERIALPTGADVSPDGRHLAVLSYQRLWVFERPRRRDRWLRSPARVLDFDREMVKQNEAIAWESNESLLMTNEQREVFRIPLDALTPER